MDSFVCAVCKFKPLKPWSTAVYVVWFGARTSSMVCGLAVYRLVYNPNQTEKNQTKPRFKRFGLVFDIPTVHAAVHKDGIGGYWLDGSINIKRLHSSPNASQVRGATGA